MICIREREKNEAETLWDAILPTSPCRWQIRAPTTSATLET